MQVRAKDIFVDCSLEIILAVVAPAGQDFSERLRIIAEVGAPTVIFITYQDLFAGLLKIAFKGHVGHETRAATLGVQIEYPDTFEIWPLEWFIVVA